MRAQLNNLQHTTVWVSHTNIWVSKPEYIYYSTSIGFTKLIKI